MLRFLYALVLGLVGVGIVHVTILFMLPAYSVRDVWTRLSTTAQAYETVVLSPSVPGGRVPTPRNPFLKAAACRFDLSEGVLHVRATGRVPFWSMAIYDDRGLNVFSISDRAAAGDDLDVVVASTAQMLALRRELPAEFAQSVFVESEIDQGVALVRLFVPDKTWTAVAGAFLENMRCEPL
ncbi:DUF1254 domain-containing protein [Nitratireductor luteus]|uniref:DUF1254 domain-containing protein n=1 Tax=Nitratireductor luteus TaxID=2976980 RepID=UPI00223F75AE|nr:DUF1254 domain-containing protein [Nitratireductor luteus]